MPAMTSTFTAWVASSRCPHRTLGPFGFVSECQQNHCKIWDGNLSEAFSASKKVCPDLSRQPAIQLRSCIWLGTNLWTPRAQVGAGTRCHFGSQPVGRSCEVPTNAGLGRWYAPSPMVQVWKSMPRKRCNKWLCCCPQFFFKSNLKPIWSMWKVLHIARISPLLLLLIHCLIQSVRAWCAYRSAAVLAVQRFLWNLCFFWILWIFWILSISVGPRQGARVSWGRGHPAWSSGHWPNRQRLKGVWLRLYGLSAPFGLLWLSCSHWWFMSHKHFAPSGRQHFGARSLLQPRREAHI